MSCTAGKTKHLQTLLVGTDLILCDCPGLVMPQVGTVSTLATARTTLRHPRALHGTAQYSDRHSTAIVAWLCSHSGSVFIGRSVLSWSVCAPAVLARSDRMPCQHAGWDTLLVLGCTCTGRLVEG